MWIWAKSLALARRLEFADLQGECMDRDLDVCDEVLIRATVFPPVKDFVRYELGIQVLNPPTNEIENAVVSHFVVWDWRILQRRCTWDWAWAKFDGNSLH